MTRLSPQTTVYNRTRRPVQAQQHLVNVYRMAYMDKISGIRLHRCLNRRYLENMGALMQSPSLNSGRIQEGGL
jgi:hypothetical protein